MTIDVPISVETVERRYGLPNEQDLSPQLLLRMTSEREGLEVDYKHPMNGIVRWPVEQGQHLFVIENTIRGAVVPAWTPRRGFPWRHWGALLENPDRHVLLDFAYHAPPDTETLAIQLFWPNEWKPLAPITESTLVIRDGDRTILRHAFEVPAAMAIDTAPHQMRVAAIAGFVAASLLFWLVWLIRERVRLGRVQRPDVDEAFVRKRVFEEPPDVVAAEWSGRVVPQTIESFLRRLERNRKIALQIKTTGDGDDEDADLDVHVRLLVSRTSLSEYERAGLNALMPDGATEVSTAEVRRRGNEAADPELALQEVLERIAESSRGPQGDAPLSKFLSAILFWGGLGLFAVSASHAFGATMSIFIPIVAAIVFVVLWPDTFVRRAILIHRWTTFAPLVAIPILLAIVIAAHLLIVLPPLASVGLALFAVACLKAVLSQSTGRESTAALQRATDLARARAWLRANPPAAPERDPWLDALGLPTRGPRQEREESWGWALMPIE